MAETLASQIEDIMRSYGVNKNYPWIPENILNELSESEISLRNLVANGGRIDDTAVIGDTMGTMSAKLRGVNKSLEESLANEEEMITVLQSINSNGGDNAYAYSIILM